MREREREREGGREGGRETSNLGMCLKFCQLFRIPFVASPYNKLIIERNREL